MSQKELPTELTQAFTGAFEAYDFELTILSDTEMLDGATSYVNFDQQLYPYEDTVRGSIFLQEGESALKHVAQVLIDMHFDGLEWALPQHQFDNATFNYVVGLGLYSQGRFDEAARRFERMMVDQTKSVRVASLFYQANCALLTGDYTSAARLLERLYALAGHQTLGYFTFPVGNLGWLYLMLDRSEDAFNLLRGEIATADAFDRVALYMIRSQLYALAFRYDEAIADMDAAIALEPDNPLLYVERGQRILLLYEWDRALADYNRALELATDYADAYYYRGVLYASVPEGVEARQSALDDFERYLELAPNGEHAEDAARYAAEIAAQLASLTAP